MTPSEMTTMLARVNERIRSSLTGASSLVCLVVVTLVAAFVLHRVPSGMAKTVVVLALAGAAGLLVLVAGPDVVRIAPSLVISLDEILEGLSRLELALNRALT